MYNTESLRESLAGLMSEALTSAGINGYPINFGCDATGADRYMVFSLQDLPPMDERNQIELEINVVAPQSDNDEAEKVTDTIMGALDKSVNFSPGFFFYIYRNTRNRVDGSDMHTVRIRCTFDIYLYERVD